MKALSVPDPSLQTWPTNPAPGPSTCDLLLSDGSSSVLKHINNIVTEPRRAAAREGTDKASLMPGGVQQQEENKQKSL